MLWFTHQVLFEKNGLQLALLLSQKISIQKVELFKFEEKVIYLFIYLPIFYSFFKLLSVYLISKTLLFKN